MKNFWLMFYFEFVSLINVIICLPLLIPSYYLTPIIYFFMINSYLLGLSFIMKTIYGCQIKYSDKTSLQKMVQKKRKILLPNHFSEFDYLFLYNLIGLADTLRTNI